MKQHHSKIIADLKLQNRIFKTILFFTVIGGVLYTTKPEVISPCPDQGCGVSVVYAQDLDVDKIIDKYSNQYGKTKWEKLTIKTKLHYLLLRESAYGNTKSCGDSGLACGPLQFHQATYIAFREIMLSKGLVHHIGDRTNMIDAIETTAWALADGRENNWGPILRGDIKI